MLVPCGVEVGYAFHSAVPHAPIPWLHTLLGHNATHMYQRRAGYTKSAPGPVSRPTSVAGIPQRQTHNNPHSASIPWRLGAGACSHLGLSCCLSRCVPLGRGSPAGACHASRCQSCGCTPHQDAPASSQEQQMSNGLCASCMRPVPSALPSSVFSVPSQLGDAAQRVRGWGAMVDYRCAKTN